MLSKSENQKTEFIARSDQFFKAEDRTLLPLSTMFFRRLQKTSSFSNPNLIISAIHRRTVAARG